MSGDQSGISSLLTTPRAARVSVLSSTVADHARGPAGHADGEPRTALHLDEVTRCARRDGFSTADRAADAACA